MEKNMSIILRAGYETSADSEPDIRIIIDVFRASTTTLAILEGGAESLLVTNDFDEIKKHSENGYLVVSEVFDLGIDNSPSLIKKRGVIGSKLILKTSNLTTALEQNYSGEMLIACFNNLSAIFEYLIQGNYKNIEIIPAGQMAHKKMNREDLHCAEILKSSLESKKFQFPDEKILKERIDEICKSPRPLHYVEDLHMAVQTNISKLVPKVKLKTTALFEVLLPQI